MERDQDETESLGAFSLENETRPRLSLISGLNEKAKNTSEKSADILVTKYILKILLEHADYNPPN